MPSGIKFWPFPPKSIELKCANIFRYLLQRMVNTVYETQRVIVTDTNIWVSELARFEILCRNFDLQNSMRCFIVYEIGYSV